MVFNETIPRIRVPLTPDERRGNRTKPHHRFATYVTYAAGVVGIRGMGGLSARYRSRVGFFFDRRATETVDDDRPWNKTKTGKIR